MKILCWLYPQLRCFPRSSFIVEWLPVVMGFYLLCFKSLSVNLDVSVTVFWLYFFASFDYLTSFFSSSGFSTFWLLANLQYDGFIKDFMNILSEINLNIRKIYELIKYENKIIYDGKEINHIITLITLNLHWPTILEFNHRWPNLRWLSDPSTLCPRIITIITRSRS